MSEQSIFLAAMDISDPSARAAYLTTACAGNDPLRREIEALLAAHERPGVFLDEPAVAQMVAPGTGETHTVAPGDRDFAETRAPESAGDDVLAFLRPPSRAGSLGRLDHHEVLEVLGRGGFGTVLRAFDDRLHRVVAIKVMAPQLAASGAARARFLREGRSAAAVRDEHVVNVHAVSGDDEPIPYLVMEFVAGQTLQQKLDRVGPLSVAEVLRIGGQIARGLSAAHATGLIHRDIKPANILLENGVERVKITDFGLARAADDASISQSGVVAGTPMYMAPEQARGEAIDHRADLFSLGSVLYAMLTGRPPFRADTTLAVLKRVCEDDPRPVREVNPAVPQWLADVVAKLHAKNPADRFQTAKDVAELLAKYLIELQMHGTVTPQEGMRPVQSGRSPRRRPVPLFAIVAVGLLGLVGLAGLSIPVYLWMAADREEAGWTTYADWQELPGWGRVVDPGKDCRIEEKERRLRITVPGKDHDFSAWFQAYNAPRTVREVRGDFRMRVRVRPFKDIARPSDGPGSPYLTGDLFVWKDKEHVVRLGRTAATNDRGERVLRNDLVCFRPGLKESIPVPADLQHLDPNAPSYLELERRGDALTARTSTDGENWSQPFQLPSLDLPEKVLVGVVAVCTNTSAPFRVEFEGFELTPLAPPVSDKDGWVQLFNGKDLNGWTPNPGFPGKWEVKAGVLVLTGLSQLESVRDYRDFHLRASVRSSAGHNATLVFRAANKVQGIVGFDRRADSECRPGTTGIWRDGWESIAEYRHDLVPASEWIELELIVRGNRVKVTINGTTTTDATAEHLPGYGRLKLQEHARDGVLEFRKVEIKELPPDGSLP